MKKTKTIITYYCDDCEAELLKNHDFFYVNNGGRTSHYCISCKDRRTDKHRYFIHDKMGECIEQ